ncbi:MAG: helix-turn-helix transcriptional regulator [Planococcaceae bacterium]|nr:helix-turn-helix transcriptional regulator [Planococcaceae bacterium]
MQWNLIRLRKEHGLNQKELEKVIGMKPGTYGRKERGELEFRISEMIAIHQYFNVSMDEIFLPTNCILNAKTKESESVEKDAE